MVMIIMQYFIDPSLMSFSPPTLSEAVVEVQPLTAALKKAVIQSLAQRHLRKMDACQQGGLNLGTPVKQLFLSLPNMLLYLGVYLDGSGSKWFCIHCDPWGLGGFLRCP